MPKIDIKIENLEQIRSAFSKSPTLMTYELRAAIIKIVRDIRDQEMSEYLALGIGIRSANLITSIYHGFYAMGLRGEVGPNVTNSEGTDLIRPAWHGINHYSFFVHEGTKFMPAKPFLYNAVQAQSDRTNKTLVQAVDNVLNKIASMV